MVHRLKEDCFAQKMGRSHFARVETCLYHSEKINRNKEELLGQEIAANLEYKSDTLQTHQTEGSLKDTDKGLIHIPKLIFYRK